ncbi:MAG: MBL fold metallo-hydrolase [Deltaproteobacteria bacterium]|nr:MBL fold metallo-hydrolase [Deltaproteobacteria bacterium]MBW2053154.1 MBL fold metallo-hydrolase [Deltaproteobacteria bacterium]MBW2141605.1 MBL fold metallo-hydrolase [Deltaproteobacteria bacterium]MBW2324148.1 MBL fold metallo-hydrolase [Deltaproteobacteria bacterium]
MKIINLTADSKIYTSNVYYILGDWKGIKDVNTLIDVGRDSSIIKKIKQLDTGVGKKKVERVVLTHGHFDHVSLLPIIKNEFDPEVYAFNPFNGVHALKDEQTLKIGDRMFEVIHTPGHTNDSICLYCQEDAVIFSGDTSLIINQTDGSYHKDFISAFEKIARKNITSIYPGHGEPITSHVKKLIYMSLDNIRKV